MIASAFDNQSPAKINPRINETAPAVEAMIFTFSHQIEKYVVENYPCEKVGELLMAHGSNSVYRIEYHGKKYGFSKTWVGAPACVAAVEEIREILRTDKIIHFGGAGTGFSVGDEGFEIAGEVAPREGEKVFVKTVCSSFSNKDFTAYLEEAKDEDLMIVGLQTNFCVDATVKSAFERGYYVVIPEGTNSTVDNPYMTGEITCAYYFNEVWPGVFADCVSMDKAMEMIRNGVESL